VGFHFTLDYKLHFKLIKKGVFVSKDMIKTAELYTKAAEQGNAVAQLELGNCYYYGTEGVEENKSMLIGTLRL
jgi:TPR repeat protein